MHLQRSAYYPWRQIGWLQVGNLQSKIILDFIHLVDKRWKAR